MKKSARKTHTILVIVFFASIILSLVIFVSGWIYIFKLSGQLGKTRTESEYLTKELQALDDLSTKYKKVGNGQILAMDSIPVNKEVSSFVADMETLAEKNGLKIKEVVVGAGKDKGKVGDWDLSQMVKKEDYYELSIKFSIQGSYANFTTFSQEINSLRRVTSISEVNIFKTTQALAERKDEVKAEFLASIYVKE